MKINKKKFKQQLLLWYPLLNLIVAYIFKGDMMNTFSIIICGVIILFSYKKMLKGRVTIITIFWLFVTLLVSIFRDTKMGIVNCITYLVTIVVFMIYVKEDVGDLKKYFLKCSREFFVMEIIFFLLLIVYVYQYGFTAGWDTYVLQGPYIYPHTLAYIMLLMLMVNCYIWMNSKKGIAIFFALICAGGVVLTAVRTVLISVAIIALYVMYKLIDYKKFKKIIFCFSLGIVTLIVAYKMGMFDIVIHKTQLALANSSISNGRGKIFEVSLRALSERMSAKCLFWGVGMDALQANNLRYMGAAIHAHNDLIDILVCYGVPNLCIYLIQFYKFSKNKLFWYIGSLGALILFNGLFTYIDCIPLLVYARILFEESNDKSINTIML